MSEPAYIGTVVRTRGALLTLQHGIATRQQLAAVGVSDAQLAAELAGRRWRRLNEHVIATHNGPLTRRQSMWAVVLSAPPPALLCSLTVSSFTTFRVTTRIWSMCSCREVPVSSTSQVSARRCTRPGASRLPRTFDGRTRCRSRRWHDPPSTPLRGPATFKPLGGLPWRLSKPGCSDQ